MHIDARSMENNTLVEGDLCIIGAGAAGISLALEWINATSKVILLEGGGFQYDQSMQDLYKGKTTGVPYYPLETARLHYFGGTTGHWAGYCSPLDEQDFEERPWIPMSGWPFKKSELDPYYIRAQQLLELGPYEYDPEYWLNKNPSLEKLPLRDDHIRHKIWQFSPPTRFGEKYRKTIVESRNVSLYTYANVVNIIPGDSKNVIEEVVITNHAGKTHRIRAKHFVLACCAIQNARIMLASNDKIPAGIGNDHDLVGRYFMDHLEVNAGELHLPSPKALDFYLLQFFYTKMRAEIGLNFKVQERLQSLNGTAALVPVFEETYTPTNEDTSIDKGDKNLRGWENAETYFRKGELKKEEARPAKKFQLFTRMEQAPNPDSRITLLKEKDALGMPRASLEWKPGKVEKNSLLELVEQLGKEAGFAGIGRVKIADWLLDSQQTWPSTLGGGYHHMGTTRMSDNPQKGVVDSNCRVHGIENLFIAGSSCFPTSGAANPTLTLVSLTLRLSDYLKQKV